MQPPLAMQIPILQSLPAAPLPSRKPEKVPSPKLEKAARLKVLDEVPPARRQSYPPAKELAPMPCLPARMPLAELEWDDAHFAGDFPELDGSGTFSSHRRLPRFVPLQPELYAVHRDPWSVYSVADMLRIYLPEISISTGLVAVAGVLGGRLFSRFAGGSEMLPVLAGYMGLHILLLASIYGSAKANPSVRTRSRMRHLLLGCFLLLTSHLLANGLLMAGV
jgi:hypothetical protein